MFGRLDAMADPLRRTGPSARLGHGIPLDAPTRAVMERGFAHDFSAVRLHADASAGRAARDLRARAFTSGSDIVFAPGAYAPGTGPGRRLIAHELAHVAQQRGTTPTSATPDTSREAQADAAAHRVLLGGRAAVPAAVASGPQLEGEGEGEKKPADAGEEIVKGLKTMGEKVMSNKSIKEKIEKEIKPVLDAAKAGPESDWRKASTAEKGLVIGTGVGMIGGAYGAALSNPGTRKSLAGVNLAAPLTLVPYVPLQKFSYTLPTGADLAKRKYGFSAELDFGDWLKPVGKRLGVDLAAKGDLSLTYDPVDRDVDVKTASATIAVGPLSVAGKVFEKLPGITQKFPGPDDILTNPMSMRDATAAETPKAMEVAGWQVVATVDLAKLIPALGGGKGRSTKDEPSERRRARR